ncbi:MAG: hypothetical protein HFF18_03110 [Oscillospiraceae bacterium]|nr:hypothetical protein [Oscillospiraceae bacterium]
MTSNLNLILTAPQAQAHAAAGYGVPVAHMSYRVGPGPQLLRGGIPAALRGGFLMMDDQGYTPERGGCAAFCQQVLRECALRGYTGVIADWENPPGQAQAELTQAMDQALNGKGWPLFVTEPYAKCAPHARVMISSAVSGGSLSERLSEAAERYGIERIALAVERCAEDFTMPSPSGAGNKLSGEALGALMEEYRPATYFSNELCAHYFTYRPEGQSGVHFVLYDDGGSIRKKLQTARNLGISYALMAYPEVSGLLPDVLSL